MSVLDFSASDFLGTQLHDAQTTRVIRGITRLDADVVVVGAGPGGLTAASVLAEAGMRVVIFEAGQFWGDKSFKRKQSWALEHLYQDRGQRMLVGNAFISLQSGRGVGGGTLVNSAISFRAPANVLRQWVTQQGIELWEPSRSEALYRQVEAVIGARPTRPQIAGKNTEIARRGCAALGMDAGYMPRSAPGCVGCGACQMGCPTKGKATGGNTWLPRIMRAGGQLHADTRVESILMESGRAVGARAVTRDPKTGEVLARLVARAPRIILAAGAVNTPLLLQRQGLANSSGMVGRNLRCHPGVGAVAKFGEDVFLWQGATQGYYAHHPEDAEILLETFSVSPDLLVAQAGGVGEEAIQFLKDLRRVAACGVLIRDGSKGSVSYRSGDRPSYRYHLLPQDVRKLSMGLKKIGEVFFAAGAESVRPALAGARFFRSAKELNAFIARSSDPMEMQLYASHPMGTCRMGEDPGRNVVRPRDGRTHDVEGLYIADASLFPTALGVNPQMTIMAQSLALGRQISRSA